MGRSGLAAVEVDQTIGDEVFDAVVVCIDMWDSLLSRRRQQELVQKGLRFDIDYLDSYDIVEKHNACVFDEFGVLRTACSADSHLVKLLGDGSIFVFRSVDAMMAVLFAVRAVIAVNHHLREHGVNTSAAIAAGTASVRTRDDPGGLSPIAHISGYPVDVASRLAWVAGPSQVLMCGQAVRLFDGLDSGEQIRLTEWQDRLPSTITKRLDGAVSAKLGTYEVATVDATGARRLRRIALPSSGEPWTWHEVDATQLVSKEAASGQIASIAGGPVVPIKNSAVRRLQIVELRQGTSKFEVWLRRACAPIAEIVAEYKRGRKPRYADAFDDLEPPWEERSNHTFYDALRDVTEIHDDPQYGEVIGALEEAVEGIHRLIRYAPAGGEAINRRYLSGTAAEIQQFVSEYELRSAAATQALERLEALCRSELNAADDAGLRNPFSSWRRSG